MLTTEFTVNKQKLEVELQRVFNAPIDAVWDAHVKPELVAKWWGPRFLETHVESLDVEVGGKWRILHKEPSGKEHWFHGEYKEVKKPSKIVRTFIYEPVPDQVMSETVLFEETSDGMTRLTIISTFPSQEALDSMVNSGMEFGARDSVDRLAELVEGK
jgi:uncharacterized protein YndB with AHSA1/START domain